MYGRECCRICCSTEFVITVCQVALTGLGNKAFTFICNYALTRMSEKAMKEQKDAMADATASYVVDMCNDVLKRMTLADLFG